jgi:microcystin-dependent protein
MTQVKAYNSSTSAWEPVIAGPAGATGPTGAAGADGGVGPTGSVVAFAGSTAPTGWVLCNGAAVSRTTYADLFSVVGTTYGVGDGSTTFNLPTLTGRIPVGRDTGDANFNTLGETGGATTHTHTPGTFSAAIGAIAGNIGRIGYQAGSVIAGGPTTSTYGISGTIQGAQSFSHYTPVHGVTSTGSSLQPYIVMNYIIKA